MDKSIVLLKIEEAGYVLGSSVEDTNFYFTKGDVVLSYTVPHEGNGNRHMIRADYSPHFDRWSNAEIESFVKCERAVDDALGLIWDYFLDVPYTAEDYRLASEQGLDLTNHGDWEEYFMMGMYAENDVLGDPRFQRD